MEPVRVDLLLLVFNNGILLCFGLFTMQTGWNKITFPISYTEAPHVINTIRTPSEDSTNGGYSPFTVQQVTSTYCNQGCVNNAGVGWRCPWFSIGF